MIRTLLLTSIFTFLLTPRVGAADGGSGKALDQTSTERVDGVRRDDSAVLYFGGHNQTVVALGEQQRGEGSLALLPTPISLPDLLTDMAKQLDVLMRQSKLPRVGVPEFTVGEAGARLDRSHGSLPTFLANELSGQLVRLSGGDYEVIAGNALRATLDAEGIGAKDIGTHKTVDLNVSGLGVPALAIGRIRGRDGARIWLGCDLQNMATQALIGSANGSAFLNDSEWGMLGHSAHVPDNDSSIALPENVDARIERLDRQANQPVNRDHPFCVSVWVRDDQGVYHQRKGVERGNDYVVTLRPKEVYQIGIQNKYLEDVFLRLLVDGLNTLPHHVPKRRERRDNRFDVIEREDEYQIAPRVSLDKARAWHLDSAKPGSDSRDYSIRGFYSRTGSDGRCHPFVVAKAPESASAREKYTESIGLITAAFYEAVTPSKSSKGISDDKTLIITDLGSEETSETGRYDGGKCPGRLITVLNIRYEAPPVSGG